MHLVAQMEYLVLMVKHHDPVGSHTDRMLGMVIVDTATALQAPGISIQEWFPVRKGPGMKAGDVPQGKVHVKVRYYPLQNKCTHISGATNTCIHACTVYHAGGRLI